MPISKISNTLNPADWIKKAGPAEKTIGMATQLKDLTKQHEDLQSQELGTSGLSTVEDVQSRIQEIEGGFSKSVDAFAKKAKLISDAAKKAEADLKKSNAEAAKAAAAVAQAATAEAQEVAKAVPAALAALRALQDKLEAQEKKDKAAADKAAKKDEKGKDEEEEDPSAEKDEKKFRDKVKDILKSALKKVKGEGAPPAKFTVVVLGKAWGVYLGKSAGESEKKSAMRLAGVTSGFKHCKGLTYWDPKGKCWVFEGPNIPVGRANATAMSLALKPIIGYAPRLRLQKPGERGEDMEGGEDDPDDKAQAVAADPKAGGAGGPAGVEPIKAFTARLAALMPKVKAAAGDQIKSAAAKAAELAGKGDAVKANALLDQIEKMLSVGGAAAAAAGAAAGAGGKLSIVQLGKARVEWAAVRAEAVKGIEQLAKQIEQEYRDEPEQRTQVQAACGRLRGLAARLKEDLEDQLDAALNAKEDQRDGHIRTVKATLTSVLQLVATDPLMKEIDGNELMPNLQVVKPMQARLRDIAMALG